MTRARCLAPLVLLLPLGLAHADTEAPAEIHVAGNERPRVLDAIPAVEDVAALAISPDGRQAAVARRGEGPDRLELYESGAAHPTVLEVPGHLRDLLFSSGGTTLLGLQHKPAKRGEGESRLLRLDPLTLEAERALRLPPSARALDEWREERLLLVAVRDEIRTVRLPELYSGPLYPVPGVNMALASLGGGSRVLVGQADRLLLVDLSDPPTRESMPLREQTSVPAPVAALAAAPDGKSALVRLDDGRVYRAWFDPLRLDEVPGRAAVLARAEPTSPPPRSVPLPPPEPSPTAVAEARIRASAPPPPLTNPATGMDLPRRAPPRRTPEPPPERRPPAGETSTQPAPSPEPANTPERIADTPPEHSSERPPEPVIAAPAPPDESGDTPIGDRQLLEAPPALDVAAARPPDTSSPVSPGEPRPRPGGPVASPPGGTGPPRVEGRLTGPAASGVIAVVLRGPDNLLQEAARVTPGSDGRWSAEGLRPGRYRVQLDGGGGSVLVSDPAFLVLDVTGEGLLVAPNIEVLQAL